MINLQFSWTTITIISFILFFIVIGLTIGIIMFLNKNKEEERKVGSILEFDIKNEGSGYAPGQIGKFSGGKGKDAYFKIKNVDSNGSIKSINDIELLSKGVNYLVNDILILEHHNKEKFEDFDFNKFIGLNMNENTNANANNTTTTDNNVTNAMIQITKVGEETIDDNNLNLIKTMLGENVPETDPTSGTTSNTTDYGKQVFNTNKKMWNYEDAPYVCKNLGAELATYDQLVDAAKNGANWCNIGWFKESVIENENGEKMLAHAGFPVQKEYYNQLQNDLIDESDINKCGPELNPIFKDENYSLQNVGMYDNYKFSVNCYGEKREPTTNESSNYKLDVDENNENVEEKLFEFNKEVKRINEINPNIELLPFNTYKNVWSNN